MPSSGVPLQLEPSAFSSRRSAFGHWDFGIWNLKLDILKVFLAFPAFLAFLPSGTLGPLGTYQQRCPRSLAVPLLDDGETGTFQFKLYIPSLAPHQP